MTLPSSFPLSASQINVELGRASNAVFNINGSEERTLAGVPSGPISFASFLGKTHRGIVQTDNRVDFSSQSGAVITFSSVALGTSGFMACLFEHGDQDNNPGLTPTCTIDGVNAVRYQPHSTGSGQAQGFASGTVIFIAAVTHTVGDVIITWNGNINVLSLVALNVIGYSSTPSSSFGGENGGFGQNGTVNANIPANGAAIAIRGDGSDNSNTNWTGLTERSDISWHGNRRTWAWDYNMAASGSYTIAVSGWFAGLGGSCWSGIILTPT